MSHARVSQKKALCKVIQSHLARHPFAADTAKGIVGAWLPAHGFEDAAAHISEVLAELVADEWLRPHALPDGNVLYAANLKKCSCSLPIS